MGKLSPTEKELPLVTQLGRREWSPCLGRTWVGPEERWLWVLLDGRVTAGAGHRVDCAGWTKSGMKGDPKRKELRWLGSEIV